MTEAQDQAAVVEWCKWREAQFPPLAFLYHVPNGMPSSRISAARFVAQGLKRGVPDLCLPVPAGDSHGLYIEMKSSSSHHGTSPEQAEYIEGLTAMGYRAWVCKSPDEAIRLILTQVVEHMSNQSRKNRRKNKQAAIAVLARTFGDKSRVRIISCPEDEFLAGMEQDLSTFVDFLQTRAFPAGTVMMAGNVGGIRRTIHYTTAEQVARGHINLPSIQTVLLVQE